MGQQQEKFATKYFRESQTKKEKGCWKLKYFIIFA